MQVLRGSSGPRCSSAAAALAPESEPVTLKFYHWWSWQAPLIFIVLIAFATGVAAGLLAGAVRAAAEAPAHPPAARSRAAGRRAGTARAVPGRRGENAASAVNFAHGGPLDGI